MATVNYKNNEATSLDIQIGCTRYFNLIIIMEVVVKVGWKMNAVRGVSNAPTGCREVWKAAIEWWGWNKEHRHQATFEADRRRVNRTACAD